MNINCEWTKGFEFVAHSGQFAIEMDAPAPFGKMAAPTPKDYVLASLCSCAGMDIMGLLKRSLQRVEKFTVVADATLRETHPKIFTNISLKFLVEGDCDSVALMEAVYLSQTKYCSVSAMLTHTTHITYDVILNGKALDRGNTQFQEHELV